MFSNTSVIVLQIVQFYKYFYKYYIGTAIHHFHPNKKKNTINNNNIGQMIEKFSLSLEHSETNTF